ncbi:MAG: 2-amino-4-hydroxy-6-hydroxymethyldihydropteridine diphosphokinase [Parvibaculum sp.]|uniref:2-amino-4-hydroxy-6- hydroxymethyldihydropteridine diphosphokinase n=1 Tax=Parvibaculum sp. TaxID=2024848 RepID=UPI0025F3F278|nr:2-amino-4-hydroxy-6-hydroxymethyldihydropteridine diphosphokinase [Parvibaculum sp.]MCE9648900.1 2-amino-4-hydroxy-6-hydroxymethyldihydropteridine diphosphokinase [Parvibaculum sp.]
MILIGLGANLPTVHGAPRATLEAALSVMPSFGITVRRRSSFYRTPAVAQYVQPPYVNAVAIVDTALPARELLAALHRVEAMFGRVRQVRWAARTLDLDLLDYQGQIVTAAGPRGPEAGAGPLPLALPHPGLASRGFVLVPLVEIAPEWRHPVLGEGAARLIERVKAAEGVAAIAEIKRIRP